MYDSVTISRILPHYEIFISRTRVILEAEAEAESVKVSEKICS